MDTEDLMKYMELIIQNQNMISNQNQELIFAHVFHDTIKGSEWLPSDFAFSPGRGALGYPALYVLYRILNEFHPQKILEMGMGQSTKMIGLYNHKYTNCRHQVVEHDSDWITFFTNHFKMPESTEVVELPIEDTLLQIEEHASNVTVYQGFYERFMDHKYDFICIDGPYGFRSPDYSRVDIISILPDCLESSFVIMLDDCQRNGEYRTYELISDLLKENGIVHSRNIYNGEKGTGLIVSEDLSFLCTM